MINILTIDVEDWESGISGVYGKIYPSTEKVYKKTIELLELLEKYNARGTFFILGDVAEKYPKLIKDIFERGNEVASHCFYHRELHYLNLNELREDLKKSKNILEQIIGKEIIGFRAPNFSLMKVPGEVLDLLLDLGFKYDSSIFPYKKYNGMAVSLEPFWLETKNKRKIFEIPLTIYNFGGIRIPCCGGAFLRNYPFVLTRFFFEKINKKNRRVVFYTHSHEFEEINFKNLNMDLSFIRKYFEKRGRGKVKNIFLYFLKNFQFNSIENIFSQEIVF